MRVFVAVVPAPAAVEHLDAALDRTAGLRWVRPERWHVTLAFLGDEVPEDRVASLAAALRTGVGGIAPFRLALAGAGTFPRRGRPRVLWAGLTGDLDALTALAEAGADAARTAGTPPDGQPFRPHLTLAYYRRGPVDRGPVERFAAYRGLEFSVSEVVVVASRLGPDPCYDRLATAPLAGSS